MKTTGMPVPLCVLLIDDDPNDRYLALRELRKEFPDIQAEQVTESKGLDEALDRGGFDLVVTDYQLRWTNGIAVLGAVKERYPNCPIIMFTATGSEEIAVEAMKNGLDDYVVKKTGQFVRLRAAARAILEHAEMARRAAEMERRYETLLSRLEVGVFRSSVDGDVQEANEAFLNLVQISSQEANSEIIKLRALFLRESEYVDLLRRLLKSGEAQDREVELRGSEKSVIWVRLSMTLTAMQDGDTVIDGIAEDITERKRNESDMRDRAAARARLALLSPRENQVLELVVGGKTNKTVARDLFISVKTVEMHRSKLMRKLQVDNVADLVRLTLGIDPPDQVSG